MGVCSPSRNDDWAAEGLVPGTRLRLEVTVGNATATCVTRVREARTDAIVVEPPLVRFEERMLSSGTPLAASYEMDGKRRSFATRVVGHGADGDHLLALPERIDGGEQRSWFRLPLSLPADRIYRIVTPPPGERDELHDTVIDCTVLDLSEGGVRLSTRSRLRQGEWLGLELTLPRVGRVIARMVAVRVEAPEAPRRNYRAGCEFRDISPGDRARIREYVLARQRRHLRGGR